MKHLLTLPYLLILFCLTAKTYSQEILFSEDFEAGEIPLSWKNEFVTGSINWRFEPGGYSLNPEIPNSRKPMTPHGGEYNALFQFQSAGSEATKLVTRKIDALEFGIKPELHFFHAQMEWKHGNDYYNDYLRVYYKSSENASWTLLRSYTEVVESWVERIILLPENDLSADYYLAFEGETKWGYGACIDDIQIIETGILPKSLADIKVEQVSNASVSSGTTNNPILKLKLKVTGNSGTLPLNSLVLQSLNTSDDDIDYEGVKIFFTNDAGFSTDQQIGSGVTFSNGQASFSGLNFDLPTGYSYLWITYDVKPTAGHRNTIDAKFTVNSININDITYFNVEESPAGSSTIMQTIYSENFDDVNDWVMEGEFEQGIPQGLGGLQGNPDPLQAYSGSNVIGTDLSGLGEYPGDYEKNLYLDEYSAVSDTIDLTYFNDLSLRYMRHLNIGVNDEAFIKVSPDGGQTWQNAWSNSSMILDDTWKFHEVDITPYAARKKKVLIKYSVGTTNDYWQLSGWNIDNVTITGKYVTKDVGISRIISPVNGCGHTTSDPVTVVVKNFGAEDSYGVIPLTYSIDGKKTFILDTLYQVIPFGDSAVFTFKKKADLSVADLYSVYISTTMNGDDDLANNAINKSIYIQPTRSADHSESFEVKGGLWIPSLKTWEWGTPGFGIIPPSGIKLWATKLTSNYPDNDSSFIESICYSNPDNFRKLLKFKYWVNAEEDHDGAYLQYSLDNGSSWHLLDTVIADRPWYNDTLVASGARCWSGFSNGWADAVVILPRHITDAPVMKFRMTFKSDEYTNNVGFAFDNFSVFEAPPDLGVTSIAEYGDACQYVNPDRLTVDIKNFGMNPVRTNDTVIVGFSINEGSAVTDTFKLSADLGPGNIIQHTFSKSTDVSNPGNYHLSAFTLSEADPWFYFGNNDTTSVDFEVFPAPYTYLPDTIHTREPDTVIISPFYDPDYDYLWHDGFEEREYHVKDDGWHFVTVTATRGNGCFVKDSVYVELLFYDVGVEELLLPDEHCGLGKNELLKVNIRNFGNDSMKIGQKIAVAFKLNGGTPVSDTLQLEKTLYSNQIKEFTIGKVPVDMSDKGIYNFTVYTSYAGDTIVENDTIYRSINILGRPAVNLGPDLTVQALSYVLDAGSGFETWLWDNNETTQTREVSEPGNYWVQVVDENLCDNSDTVYIWLKIRDIDAYFLESPVSDCRFGSEQAIMKILNSGTDTIPVGSVITVSYRIQHQEWVSENFSLNQPLLPMSFIVHNFSSVINFDTAGDYPVEAAAITTGDLRTDNDSLQTMVYRYAEPLVDFGLSAFEPVEEVSFEIDAGFNPHYNYEWQDGPGSEKYLVTTDGLYFVTATDTRTGCSDKDSVWISLIYGDVGVTWSDMPLTGCYGNLDKVHIKISNLGTSSIGVSAPITIAIDINGVRHAIETFTRASNFNPGEVLEMELTESINAAEGISLVEFYTYFGQDKKAENDTFSVSFETLPSPNIDFGDEDGVLTVELPYTLDAGPGHQSYQWQDNSTGQTFNVTAEGDYHVTVTGMNDCRTTKTVRVDLLSGIGDINDPTSVIIYPNPGNGLFHLQMPEQTEDITLRIISNSGQQVFIRTLAPDQISNESIDVQHLARGVYFLLLHAGDQVFRGKIVIE